MKVLIRKIRLEDSESINTLSLQLGYELNLHETLSNIKQVIESADNCAYVAVAQEKIIGWIHAFKAIRIESSPFIEIGGMVVDENYRGKGVGKALADKIKEWGREQNNNSLRVRCNTKRLESHKFYSKIGFREVKEQKIFQIEI